ncbi:head-tail connector protein [Pseudomonas sp.]|uniref:head-tail connector protein n=1 Tax=Pseudomonas sp. TaxID=306 RepID=UPI003F3CE562
MSYKVIVGPTEEPVTLAEAKAQCSIDGNEFDALLTGCIAAARQRAEHETGRALCTQTRQLALDSFPAAFVLRGAPVQSLVSLVYLGSDGVERTLDPQDTLLDKDSAPGYLLPAYGKAWPASRPVPNAVRVRYLCGYGGAAEVPAAIKTWMLLAINALFEQRGAFVTGTIAPALPDRFWDSFLDPFRLIEVA